MLATLSSLVLLSSLLHAATVTETWDVTTATVSAPDEVAPGEAFEVTVQGQVEGGFCFAWEVWQDAEWTYDAAHGVVITAGTLVDGTGIAWGDTYDGTFTFTAPDTDSRFLFVMGNRSSAHGWYDVAAEVTVTVQDEPTLCDPAFYGPERRFVKAGSTLPILFEATECETGEVWDDPGVTVTLSSGDGTVLREWVRASTPMEGIVLRGGGYHVNWKTASDKKGAFVITVRFSTGDTLSRVVIVR